MAQNILIYGGIGHNIVGALLLMTFAIVYLQATHQNKNRPIELNKLQAKWGKQKIVALGLMILGSNVVILSCFV